MITFKAIIIIGVILMLHFVIVLGSLVYHELIVLNHSPDSEDPGPQAYLHEEFLLVLRFSAKTDFLILHPVIYTNGEIIESMTDVSLVTRLGDVENLTSALENYNGTEYLRIEGYADEFHIQNLITYPLKNGPYSYEAYLGTLEFGKYESKSYFYITTKKAKISSFYSEFYSETNFCRIHNKVDLEKGIDGFEFTNAWDVFPTRMGLVCS